MVNNSLPVLVAEQKPLLLGCGILQKEIRYLSQKNAWQLETDFLDSSLHINFEKLASELQQGFSRHQGEKIVVFYGCCHPYMEKMLADAQTFRTEGQNCVEMLLGRERFMTELSQGAFFLLEDWASRWDEVVDKTFGNHIEVTREIFQLSNQFLLCLKTPCSGDFEQKANEIGVNVGLPVRWLDVDLAHLEQVLQTALGDCRD